MGVLTKYLLKKSYTTHVIEIDPESVEYLKAQYFNLADRIAGIDNVFYKNLSSSIIDKFPKSTTLPLMMPNINDLGAFRAKNIPAYASIPIYLNKEEVESIHGENEHISIEALYTEAKVYYNFLSKMQSENINDSQ